MSLSTADHIEIQPIQRQFLNPIYLMKTDTFIARSENITEQFQAGKVLHYLGCFQVSSCASKAGSAETSNVLLLILTL